MTHTPGPWEAKREDAHHWCIYDADGMLVARRLSEANVRLIAAAPDMLAALNALISDCERIPNVIGHTSLDMKVAIKDGHAAIARATGEAA